MPWGSALLAALLATLDRSAAWPVALAGFLARGGLLLFLLPIVVVPSTPGLAVLVAPTLTPIVFGQLSVGLVMLAVGLASVILLAALGGGLVGAWADLALLRDAADDEEIPVEVASSAGLVWRGLAARMVAYLPLAVALAWGARLIVDATYRELILPRELVTPILIRILADVPNAVAVVVVAWLVGEAIGGLAQRRIAATDSTIVAALGWSLGFVVRRPIATLAALVASVVVPFVAIAPALAAAAFAWGWLAVALVARAAASEVVLALIVFVSLWSITLVLAAAAATFRSFAWTWLAFAEPVARPVDVGAPFPTLPGTIGAHDAVRPGE